MKIKILTVGDYLAWKQLRLEALNTAPEAFGASFEEESALPDGHFKQVLADGIVFCAFIENQLVGCVGFNHLNRLKTKHKAIVWGMYTDPAYRGRGVARALLDALIIHAKTCVSQLQLTCTASNVEAYAFYKKFGFKTYGMEPNAVRVAGRYFDQYLMLIMI